MKKYKIVIHYLFLALYVFWAFFLIFQASLDAKESTKQSSTVTDVVVEVVNDVAGKDVIEKTPDVEQTIRKLVGHFGGFLILGIFSTFTYFFFIKKKILSISINYLSSFIIALLTEFIQLFKDGRSGEMKDVLIDYSGFLISGTIITLIIYLIIYKKKKTCKN